MSLLARFPPRWILGVLVALLPASFVVMSPWFEDPSGASDFGSSLSINAPWSGSAIGNIRCIDLDGDGIEEILVGGQQVTCRSTVLQLSVFRRDLTTNRYAQLNYGQDRVFLGIEFSAYFFEALGRSGTRLLDIIACQDISSSSLAVLENHGGLNFSMSTVALLSVVACNFQDSVIAVADTDHDGCDEVFLSFQSATDFFTRLPNTTLVSAISRFPGLPLLFFSAGIFADLDGDSYMDLIWTGSLNTSIHSAYIFRNVGGNFSSVVSSMDGVQCGSIAVAEFTGDGREDIVLSGHLVNGSGSLSLFANNGSMSFVLLPDAGFPVSSSVWYNVAAVPLRSQATALDLVIVSSNSSSFAHVSVNLNNGSGYFTPEAASWLPSAFFGAVVRGPDIGVYPSFLAMGQTNSSSYDGSTIVGYLDSGILISFASILFGNAKRAISLRNGVVAAADFNYDGCTDAFLSGQVFIDNLMKGALLAGDCSGSLRIQSVGLPVIANGAAVVRDFDHDGRLEYFATGVVDQSTSASEAFYYRFNANGIPENVSSNLPPLLGLMYSAVCVGAASGSNFDDIYVTGFNNGTQLQYFLRNARNGSFNLATVDLIEVNPVHYGSCALASGAGGANASVWMDIFSVGYSASGAAFNHMKNNRNGTFTNLVNSSAAFPGGAPTPCHDSSMVAADLNGDGRDDLFYNGYVEKNSSVISRLYFRDANGSMILSTILDATGALTQLQKSSSVAVDIDSDGDMDLVVAGLSNGRAIMAALLNDGSGNFTDGTAQVFGSLPGFSHGALAVAQFTNDSMPDLIHIGSGDFCGPRVLLQRANVSASSTTSSSSLPSSSSGSLPLAAALGGGIGGLGLLLLLCACCCVLVILCCCCAFCLIVILAMVAVALVAIVAVAIGLFAASDAGVVFFLVRGKKGRKEDVEMDEMNLAALLADAERTSEYRTIPWPEIHTVKKIGAGAFGEVMLAEWNGVEVAVKLFRNPSKEAIDDYKHEALMMAKVSHHPNVVNFIGASFPPDGMAMVLGLCAGGSLLAALERKKLDAAKKTQVLGEVASALSFLHTLGIVHRDIAARNVLLDGSGKAKLADLGLSRLLEDKQGEQTTSSTLGPVRWMAPEAIRDRKYSSASDAFSFGVLMAEVWSDGDVPYADVHSVTDVAIVVLQQGARPHIAPLTPFSQAELMRQLFSADPARRPSMVDVRHALQSSIGDDCNNSDAENNGEGDSGEYVGADEL